MSQLSDYLLGQILQRMHSFESEQHDQGESIKTQGEDIKHIAEKVDEALTWAQRIVWLGLALVGAVAINYNPEELAKFAASLLKVRP